MYRKPVRTRLDALIEVLSRLDAILDRPAKLPPGSLDRLAIVMRQGNGTTGQARRCLGGRLPGA